MKTSKQPFWKNPILAKELARTMRGRQGITLISVYLGLLTLLILGTYWIYISDGDIYLPTYRLEEIGQMLFFVIVIAEMLMIIFIAPALTSSAISAERERQTFDLLRISLLTPRKLLQGKLLAAISNLLLLIFTAIPLQSLAFMVGGIGMAELVISLILLIASAFLFGALGLYFSTIAQRHTTTATVISYGAVILPPALAFAVFYWLTNFGLDTDQISPEGVRVLLLLILVVASLNPISAGALSQIIWMEERSLLVMSNPDPALNLPAAWTIYTAYAAIMTWLMLRISEFYLRRYEH